MTMQSSPNRPSLFSRIFSHTSLRVLIVVPFIVQIIAITALTGYLSYRNGQRAVNDVAGQLRNEVTIRIQERILSFIERPQLVNELNANAIATGELDLTDSRAMERHFWQQVQTFFPVTHSYLADTDGGFHGARWVDDYFQVFVIDEETEGIRHNYAADEQGNRGNLIREYEYDPRTRPWYLDAVEAGKPAWSTIYADNTTGRLAITAVQPIYNATGELQNVLGSSFIFTTVNEFLAGLRIGKTGETFIMERSGELVTTSTEAPIFIINEDGTERILASASENALIRQTAQYVLEQNAHSLSQINGTQQLDFNLNGERQFIQVTPLADERGLDWLIVVTIPESDFMEQINANTRTTVSLTIVALVVAILFGVVILRWVTEPVLDLNVAAEALTRGEWQEVVVVNRRDELGQLAQSFNSMARQLKESFATLEAKNQELERLNIMKDEFLANTSHELRTPLNGIIGLAESMRDGAAGSISEEQEKNLSMIVSSGRRLATLVNDILDLAKMKHEELQLECKPVDIHQLTNIVLTLSQPLIGNKPLQLENTLLPNLPLVDADENRLQQIMHNLIGNAIKFTEAGLVKVSAQIVPDETHEHNMLQVTVTDTGIGIPADKQTTIFQSFEQVDASVTRAYGGTGIGLAVTKQLVNLHGGRIWVNSVVGEGSQFHFTLPISEEKEAANDLNLPTTIATLRRDVEPTLPTAKLNGNSDYTVLIVDDEAINIQVLTNYLTLHNYKVAHASDGQEAINSLQDVNPDVVLLDVMMPHLSGYETCQLIRQEYTANELPVIMLTAKNQIADLVIGFAAGANDYLTKPFAKDELMSRLTTHLRLAKMHTAYGRFVPHEFLYFLNRESILDVKLGDQVQQVMTVFFADVRSFTTISEGMTPKENFDFLNNLLSRIGPIIRNHNGFIDKYIGDAIMALFPNSADFALQASIAMLQTLRTYNKQSPGRFPVQLGIGLHTGSLMLGTIGEILRMDTTVISDAVNLASRLEGLTKQYGADLLISEQTLSNLRDPERYLIRFLDQVQVKGKRMTTRVYEVFDADSLRSRKHKLDTKDTFETALKQYYARDFVTAQSNFEVVVKHNPDDTAAQLFLTRIGHYLSQGIPEHWDGTETLTEK